MIGMILVTHGRLAEHFIDAMEHVVGKQDGVATICIGPNDDMEQRRADIADAIRDVDEGQGAIILTDLFGGTPSNLAISLLDTGHVEVIAGINLPMLIRLAGARKSMNVVEAVNAALLAAEQSTLAEPGAQCCYAQSNKHWAKDPQGVVWEMFHTMDSIPTYGHDMRDAQMWDGHAPQRRPGGEVVGSRHRATA